MENYDFSQRHTNATPTTRFGNATSFDLTLVSVDNLQCKRRIGHRIRVYAEVQLDGGKVMKTDTYEAGGPDPTWNITVSCPITNRMGGNLVVRLYYKRSVGHTCIGEVNIKLTRLFDSWRDSRKDTETTWHMQRGDLNITYRFV
ncbi:uncharacterized protein LOC125221338 [Salvia hispanica]|uniref:uncharacterized protein LOC125221338 n=1 Tax=Salvia hispanica TaxID=49212 RepID=UPI002009140F|nr:uncharacterized protein LOC125221338 [Salvia hispanica]